MPCLKPFLPDIFTQTEALFSPANQDDTAVISRVLTKLSGFSDAQLIRVEKSGGMEVNSNNFLLHTDRGDYILKRHKRMSQDERALCEQQYLVMDHLCKSDVPCPLPLKTCGNAYLSSNDGNNCFSLMEFKHGSYFSGSVKDVQDIGLAVGKLHSVLSSVPEDLEIKRAYPYLSDVDAMMFQRILNGKAADLDPMPDKERVMLEENRKLIGHAWENILRMRNTIMQDSVSLLHVDIHPHNLLMRNDEVVAFLDFDSLYQGPLKIMLGFSAFKLLRQVPVCRDKITPQERYQLVNRYFDGVFEFLPDLRCKPEEVAVYAQAELCRRIACILKLNLLDNNPEWNHVLMIQIAGLMEIELLFNRA